MSAKRCVCGLSKRFPICDGSHRSEDWTCSVVPGARAAMAYLAGPHLENLAERLAAELGGVALHTRPGPVQAERLITLTDGTDLDALLAATARVEADERMVLAVNVPAAPLATVFPRQRIEHIAAEGMDLWAATLAAVNGAASSGSSPTEQAPQAPLPPVFMSHAVADEALLQAPLDYLRRHYAADLFLCADSIDSGNVWHEAIVAHMQQRERFVLMLSRHAVASTFCAFEVGYALALGKRPLLISLDGSRPPSYIQHLHMLDLPRRASVKPWLDRAELLVEALLEVLYIDPSDPS